MSSDVIRVGVVGCGEIAQLMHLPFLLDSPAFSIAAVCDLSPRVVHQVKQRYQVPVAYTDAKELVADPSVDAVVLCTYDHCDIAVSALRAGKHLLIEKPLAFTPDEGALIEREAADAAVTCMVGYMKLFDPGFERFLDVLGNAGKARTRTVQDLGGRFDRYGALYDVIRADDLDADSLAVGRADVDARVRAHLGRRQGWADLYMLLLMLGSHDLAVLRVAFGSPLGVEYAHAVDTEGVLAVLNYPDGVQCVLRVGVGTQYEWWDEWVSVDTDTVSLRTDFGHPYVKYSPTTVSIRDSRQGHDARVREVVSHESPFQVELQHFAAAIRGEACRSTVSGAVSDLQLATDILHALPVPNDDSEPAA